GRERLARRAGRRAREPARDPPRRGRSDHHVPRARRAPRRVAVSEHRDTTGAATGRDTTEAAAGRDTTEAAAATAKTAAAKPTARQTAGGGPESSAWFERARRVTPGGVDSPVRAFGAVGGTPLVIREARARTVIDVDGRKY